MSTNSLLSIKGLTKKYGVITAINQLDLTIEQGNIYGILGPNGSGKTTTLAIILGIIKQDAGSFRWFDNAENELVNYKIGALLEVPYFYPYLSIYQNLKIIADIKKLELNADAEIDRVLQLTNLFDRKNSVYSALSLGMKQRLALASLLLGDPQILVLDEPTNGLDPQGIAEVRNIILDEAKKGKTIILASHILDEVEKVCTHVAILKKGKLIANGRVHELLSSDETVVVASDEIDKLYELIVKSSMFKKIDKINGELHVVLDTKFQPKDLNEYSFKNGFILSKFEVRKRSLESQFLEIVKNV